MRNFSDFFIVKILRSTLDCHTKRVFERKAVFYNSGFPFPKLMIHSSSISISIHITNFFITKTITNHVTALPTTYRITKNSTETGYIPIDIGYSNKEPRISHRFSTSSTAHKIQASHSPRAPRRAPD